MCVLFGWLNLVDDGKNSERLQTGGRLCCAMCLFSQTIFPLDRKQKKRLTKVKRNINIIKWCFIVRTSLSRNTFSQFLSAQYAPKRNVCMCSQCFDLIRLRIDHQTNKVWSMSIKSDAVEYCAGIGLVSCKRS